jgi:SAM-dependent methyltransferase
MEYYPNVFAVPDMDAARRIILTDEGPGADTDSRWEAETPYVLELIRESIPVGPETVILDYGCGIGRMSKALIDATGCSVIGVDISADMRALAASYVDSGRFLAVSQRQFDVLVRAGLRVHVAISVWVLQHCLHPDNDILQIKDSVAPDGHVFVLNMPTRAVPALDGNTFRWARDGLDVAALLRAAFDPVAEGTPDPARTPNMADTGAFWMALRQKQSGSPAP